MKNQINVRVMSLSRLANALSLLIIVTTLAVVITPTIAVDPPLPVDCTGLGEGPPIETIACPASHDCAPYASGACIGDKYEQMATSLIKQYCVDGDAASNWEQKDSKCVKKTVCVQRLVNNQYVCEATGNASYSTVTTCRALSGDCSM